MKWFTKILLIYIMALLVVPCSDAKNCEQTLEETTTVAHFHNQDNEDNCTPFCECICCGIPITNYQFRQIEEPIPLQFTASNKIIIRAYNVTSTYAGSIWQPPKFYS
ncbi:hypothetical protein GCM10010984_05620 [Chishuiella changwenlii]|uniref:Secreted protein n=2 Tax=Chishuiella changwenlii TaxID=1434701 RepID=A0ABQ1TCY0_9FLAO|nr:DUF6660 family protein [Chishuiella changwenlii]GGE90765.1 hypothetical protein GCM10010984_05620 [Chishuiella changwenlii]